MTIQRLALFTLLFTIVGAACRYIDGWEIDVANPGIGQAIWLITPLILMLIFRYVTKEKSKLGLGLNLKASYQWYIFSLLFFPVLTIVLVALGQGIGSLSLIKPYTYSAIFTAVLVAIPGNFIKNIFEEFVWRGYLTPSLYKAGFSRFQNHLLVGIVWAVWHLPYLDAFTKVYHDLDWYIYAPLFFVGVTVTALIYGEVRLRSGTIWTTVILHTMANAAVNTLFFGNFLCLEYASAWFLAPTVDNIFYILFVGITALIFWSSYRRVSIAT